MSPSSASFLETECQLISQAVASGSGSRLPLASVRSDEYYLIDFRPLNELLFLLNVHFNVRCSRPRASLCPLPR